jgi:hypothetical protein
LRSVRSGQERKTRARNVHTPEASLTA